MSTPAQRWQARIYVDPPDEDIQGHMVDVVVFGETLANLGANVETWLLTQQPPRFATSEIDTVTAHRRIYFYSNGQLRPFSVERVDWQPPESEVRQLLDGFALVSEAPFEEGWYLDIPGYGGRPSALKHISHAIADFLKHMTILPGPEHINRALQPEPMPLAHVRGVWRVADELQARDLVQQGWKLMAIEQENQRDRREKRPVYLLVHTDPDMLTMLLNHS